jgi:hypothetical protein
LKKNPLQKAQQKIIRKVYGNKAVLKIVERTKVYDEETGAMSDSELIFSRDVYIKNPRQVADAIVDGKNYLKGDMHVDVAFKEIADALNRAESGDPGVLAREVNIKNGGIDIKHDYLEFGEVSYAFVKITALEFFGGEPASLKLQLRTK